MRWIAKDGKLFSSREKAHLHDIRVNLEKAKTPKERLIKNLPNYTIKELVPQISKERKIKEPKPKKRKKFDPFKDKYFVYLNRSNEKGIEFDFTNEEFHALLTLPCFYCGEKSTGLDRVDNSKGYTWLNVEPACYYCNMMKFVISYSNFIARVHKIAEKHPLP